MARWCSADAAVVPVGACDPSVVVQAFFDVAVADGPAFVAEVTVIDGAESTLTGTSGGNGPERASALHRPPAGRGSSRPAESPNGVFYDTVLYTRGACDSADTEVACADEGAEVRNASRIDLDLEENEEVFVVVDAYRANTSGSAYLRAETASVGGAGAACDRDGFPRSCEEGLECLGDFDAEPTCLTVTPPTITSGSLIYNPATRSFRVLVDGLDPENNASGLEVTLLDFVGGPIPNPPFIDANFTADAGSYTASAALSLQPGALPFGASLVVTDSTGARSEPYMVDGFSEVELVPTGGACDPSGVLAVCTGHDACAENPAGGAVCEVFDGICPDAVADLHAVVPDAEGVYAWDGDTRAGVDAAAVPC